MYRLVEAIICLLFWSILLTSVVACIGLSNRLESDLPLLGIPIIFAALVYGFVVLEDRIPALIMKLELLRYKIGITEKDR